MRDPRVVVTLVVGLFLALLSVHGAGAAAPKPRAVPQNTAPIDADSLPKGAADAVTTIRWLNNTGSYQLEVQNTSAIGYLDTFEWTPPPNLTVTSVTGSSGGKCALQNGEIQCTGKLIPPKCTCEGGGLLTVNFTATGDNPTFANGYWTYYGLEGSYLHIETVTPVPYHIPSFLSGASADLPVCAKGKTSTKAHPCTTT
jgi:hypothetical protein